MGIMSGNQKEQPMHYHEVIHSVHRATYQELKQWLLLIKHGKKPLLGKMKSQVIDQGRQEE
ncbi:hypothetical protein [Alteribacter aurantiacus]|uniref:hypothetical protein n=1 Tax=Alteribacter aurantiacus TaxID=254410 RepID=UPI0004142EA4|nr:hypothetical protein [Alteribacter aurantiacus]